MRSGAGGFWRADSTTTTASPRRLNDAAVALADPAPGGGATGGGGGDVVGDVLNGLNDTANGLLGGSGTP